MEKSRNIRESNKSKNKRICPSCGKINSLTAEFCVECGKKMNEVILPFADIFSPNKEEINNDEIDNVSLIPFADTKMEPISPSEIKKDPKNKKIRPDLINPKTMTDTINKKIFKCNTDLKKSQPTEDIIKNNLSEVLIPISPLDEIKKANELLKIGAITKEEFEVIKTKYLEKI